MADPPRPVHLPLLAGQPADLERALMRVLGRESGRAQTALPLLFQPLGSNRKGFADVLDAAIGLARERPATRRILVEQLATTAAVAAMREFGAHGWADAFVGFRMSSRAGQTIGALDCGPEQKRLFESSLLASGEA